MLAYTYDRESKFYTQDNFICLCANFVTLLHNDYNTTDWRHKVTILFLKANKTLSYTLVITGQVQVSY